MYADGSNPRHLANGRIAGGAPVWSSDSQLLAFVAESRGEFAVFLARVEGNGYWQVSRVGARDAASPSWCS
jgi:Tol biopolymer transport system component